MSPWLAHTVVVAQVSNPANRPAGSRIVISARPYSRSADGVVAVLAVVGRLDSAAELHRERLHPIADAEHRFLGGEQRVADLRRAGFNGRLGPARENDPGRSERRDLLGSRVERKYFAVDADLADAPRDQLRVLRTVIENEDPVHA